MQRDGLIVLAHVQGALRRIPDLNSTISTNSAAQTWQNMEYYYVKPIAQPAIFNGEKIRCERSIQSYCGI
jgi:hypothetical protein